MKNVIGTLQRIRALREERKAREVRANNSLLMQAREEQERAKKYLDAFDAYQKEKIAEIEDEFIGKAARLKDLDWFRFKMESLKDEKRARQQEFAECCQKTEQAEQNLSASKADHFKTQRELSKFEHIAEEQLKRDKVAEVLVNEAKEEEALEALIMMRGASG